MTAPTIKIPKKRNGFYYRDGKEYVSITKIIGDVIAKPELFYWQGITCAQIALKDPTLSDKEVMAAHQLGLKKSQERGQGVHNLAERMPHVKDDEVIDEYKGYFEALKSWWQMHKPVVLYNEIEAFSDFYLTACRVDMVAVINNETWSIDFKSGKEIYKEVELQLAFGKHAMYENHKVNIQKTGVVLLKDDGGFKFEETKGRIEDFEFLLGLWNWKRRKE